MACLAPAQAPTPAAWHVPEGFVFVRDDARLLPAADRARAEAQLRSLAEATGVFGVVETGDPDVLRRSAAPTIARVEALRGIALIGQCSPDACDLSTPRAWSPLLADFVTLVAPVPEPAPGQGLPPADRSLSAWVSYVGAIAYLPERLERVGSR